MYVLPFVVDPEKEILKAISDIFHECDLKKGEDEPAPPSTDLQAAGELCKKAAIATKNIIEFVAMIASQKG